VKALNVVFEFFQLNFFPPNFSFVFWKRELWRGKNLLFKRKYISFYLLFHPSMIPFVKIRADVQLGWLEIVSQEAELMLKILDQSVVRVF
jgi:hypothetical protein